MMIYTPERLAQICLHEDVRVYMDAILENKHLSEEEKQTNIELLDAYHRVYMSKECVDILNHIRGA